MCSQPASQLKLCLVIIITIIIIIIGSESSLHSCEAI